jgi:protein-S-isoprenylcysteine O-methyltransferase Ste14
MPDKATGAPGIGRDTPGIVAPPPLVYIAALAIGFGLDAVLPSASFPAVLSAALGWPLLVVGLGLMGWFVAAFRRGHTPVDPYKATTAIVTGGPYRLSRNPGYLGMALASAGIVLLANAPWALLLLPVAVLVIDRGVIAREERYLERRFGDEYLRYKARTRRWI